MAEGWMAPEDVPIWFGLGATKLPDYEPARVLADRLPDNSKPPAWATAVVYFNEGALSELYEHLVLKRSLGQASVIDFLLKWMSAPLGTPMELCDESVA